MLNLKNQCLKYNNIEFVVKSSNNIVFNSDKIDDLIKKNFFKGENNNHIFSSLKKTTSEETLIIFLILSETINFCFWPSKEWKYNYNKTIYTGSMAMFMTLKQTLEENAKFFDINNISNIKYEEFKKLFYYIYDDESALLKKRFKMLKKNMKILKHKKNIIINNIINSKSDVELLNYIIKTFKNFNDYAYYNFKKIYFQKRAILLVRDLYYLIDNISKNIHDINNLTACADYRLPQLLREYEILTFSDKLSNIINSTVMKKGSKYETEIRAYTIYSIEKMRERLIEKGIKMNSINIDNVLWNHAKSIKNLKYNHHKVISNFY